ncbi:MAG: prenyltransferase/squalene oxidase repeat-containing protein [Acidobacteriota bacterium]
MTSPPSVSIPSVSPPSVDATTLRRVYSDIRDELLARRNARGHWRGHLSSSALSTAVACVALIVVERERGELPEGLRPLIDAGLSWLARHANDDGGWGDTVRSCSNLPTTLLSWAALHAGRSSGRVLDETGERAFRNAESWIRARAGSVDPSALKQVVEELYGADKTFSVPILTLAALAGVLGDETEAWAGPPALPFELAALPHSTFRFVGLPVVSYALPALIAVGQVQHRRRPSRWPWFRALRQLARRPTLNKLARIQPSSGGFLEAIPLTGFVTMSLAGAGEAHHPVVDRALDFLQRAVRDDGAWPIDIDLATWVTTLTVQGLDVEELEAAERESLRSWLLGQQFTTRHPFTDAAPGGWAWTDLPGGVPDADDTPGALLALHRLGPIDTELVRAASAGLRWLADLQNRDGGFPTFCRGWGKLPFDRSSPDLTAHALRAISTWRDHVDSRLGQTLDRVERRARTYLRRTQEDDGSWMPLWFGNEAVDDLGNRVYGTARVLTALADRDTHDLATPAIRYLLSSQSSSGGWGGAAGIDPSIEETALALDALARLAASPEIDTAIDRGAAWLCQAWDRGVWRDATPIGFYFANLWYFEELYPLAFALSAREQVNRRRAKSLDSTESRQASLPIIETLL